MPGKMVTATAIPALAIGSGVGSLVELAVLRSANRRAAALRMADAATRGARPWSDWRVGRRPADGRAALAALVVPHWLLARAARVERLLDRR
eukprot:3352545-Heterocapsa_arctica.AAC.1